MKKHHSIFRFGIIGSLIITIVLITNVAVLMPKNIVYNDFVINMDNWTYYTNLSSEQNKMKLPWVPEYKEDNMTIYMKSQIPDITCGKSLLIKSYMKEVKVKVNGDIIYDSKITKPNTITKSVGRGVNFVDIPLSYSGKEIEIEMFSPFPQSEGIIDSVRLSNKASHIVNIIKSDGVDNVIAFSMVFVGVGAISIFLVAFLGSEMYVNLLCIGVFSICCGSWIIGGSDLYQVVYNNSRLGYLLEFIGFYSMPIPLLIFIIKTYTLKYEKVIRGLIGVITTFLFVTLLMHFTGILEIHKSVEVFHGLIVVSVVILIITLSFDIKSKNIEFTVFFIGCTLMLLSGIWDVFLFYISPVRVVTGFYKAGLFLFTVILFITTGRYILGLTQKKIKNEMLMNIAYKDITTGLSNRRSFDEVMEEINKDINNNFNTVIIVVDLDNLKNTNDSYGHMEGDKLILLSAYILEQAYKGVGRVFRIGGDEFVIVCENQSPLDIEKYNKKRERLIEEYTQETRKNIAMSCGIAFYNNEIDENIYDVFIRADKNMYKNKTEKKKMIESAGI